MAAFSFRVTAWCLYSAKELNRFGVGLDTVDEMKEALHKAAIATSHDRLSFLRLEIMFGGLVEHEHFTTLYSELTGALFANGDLALLMEQVMRNDP